MIYDNVYISTKGNCLIAFGKPVRPYYSVVLLDGNSFCGDVVLDSFNEASQNKDNILDQIYISKYVQTVALNPNFMNTSFLRAVFTFMCIFLNHP